MHIKGALFDLDGTLLDTEPIYDEAAQKLIDEFGKKFADTLGESLLVFWVFGVASVAATRQTFCRCLSH